MAIEYKQNYLAMSDEDTDKLSLSIAPRGYEPALRDILKLVSRLETLDSLDTNGMHSLAIYARIQIFRKLTVVFDELYKEYLEVKANGQYKLLTAASLSKLCRIIQEYLCDNNNLYNKQLISSIHNNPEKEQFEEITFIIENFTSYLNNKTKECNEILAKNGIISDEKYSDKCVFEDCFKRYINNILHIAESIKQYLFVGIDDQYSYYFELAYNEFQRKIQQQWDSHYKKLEEYLIDECDDEVKAMILTIRKDVENSGFLDIAKQFHDSTIGDMDYNGIWGKLYDEDNGVIKKQKIGHILLNHSDEITASQAVRIVAFAILEPKLQNYVRERKSTKNKKKDVLVDKEELWKKIQERVYLIPTSMKFQEDPRKSWNIETVILFFKYALNIDNKKLTSVLKEQSEKLCGLFYERKQTPKDRCFDVTFLNILGYAVDKELMPNKETEIIKSITKNDKNIEKNKSPFKDGKNMNGPISEFKQLLENAYERLT